MERKFIVGNETAEAINMHIAFQEWEDGLISFLEAQRGDDMGNRYKEYEPHLGAIYKLLCGEIGCVIATHVNTTTMPKTEEVEI